MMSVYECIDASTYQIIKIIKLIKDLRIVFLLCMLLTDELT